MTQKTRNATLRRWMADYGRLVYSVAYKIVLNAQDAEDVFQNTFAKAYFKMAQLKHHKNIKAWLSLTAKNDALNKVASCWKKKVTLLETPRELESPFTDDTELLNLVRELPAVYRKCIWLYYYAGYDTNEIAELTGAAPSTVRTRLRRGREHLKADIISARECENEYQ